MRYIVRSLRPGSYLATVDTWKKYPCAFRVRRVGGVAEKRVGRGSRSVFIAYYGYAPQQVCHHCDQGSCIQPFHLFAGTPKINALDASIKGRLHRGPYANAKRVYNRVSALATQLLSSG